MAAPLIDHEAIQSVYVRHLVDMLTTNKRFLIATIVDNNAAAVVEAMDIRERISADALAELIYALDDEEQDQALSVPWIPGKDQQADAAMELMREALGQRGLDVDGGGAERFITMAVMGLGAVVNAFVGAQSERERQEAAENAAAIAAQTAFAAEQEAAAKALARKEGWKKAAPWLLVAAILVGLAIYKIVQ